MSSEYAPVAAQIDVQVDGTLRWHSDGMPLPRCTGCGSAIYERWQAPNKVWRRHKGKAEHLCWPCFMLAMDGETLGSEED